ncbi:glycosyltransferase family 2 protein [Paracoccus sp. p4-l81]|uniref:glycosyltransferase family 2 protein n=1 Tax=Paracoccus sp. p4-l81 TaxID=3342806 RepID=UPI0035BB3F71
MTRVLSITSIRNEGPFLLEWLAWMRMIGLSDFAIASNDCQDGSDAMLAALDAAGVVHHLPHEPTPGKSIQWQALQLGWRHPARKAADWVMISDVDEFPVIHAGAGHLADLFAAIPDGTEAVAMPWRLFGHDGRLTFEDSPVTAQFLRSAPPDVQHPIAATFFKSLFRPAAVARFGVHRPRQHPDRPAPLWVDGSGRPLPPHIAGDGGRMSLLGTGPARDLVEMHHYSTRSAEAFLVKAARGLPNRRHKAVDLHYWIERNFNSVENTAALRHQDALAQGIAALKALPGVADLHDRAVAWHRDQISQALRSPDSYRLFGALCHAAGSAVLPPAMERRLLILFGQLDRDE